MSLLKQCVAALRMLLLFTVVLGIAYPLAIWAVAQAPGLRGHADGSLVSRDGRVVGSSLLGQTFASKTGSPLPQYFQPRPSAAGYDPTASGASNLGPESVVGKNSLLTQVCTRSRAIGRLDGVDGSRPFCSADGTGSVLAVFWSGPGYAGRITRVVSVNQTGTPFLSTYRGVRVEPARPGESYAKGQLVPVRGDAPSHPAVPADAVTASGSGLDPDISPANALIQEKRVATARHITLAQVRSLVASYTSGRFLGFMGEPHVNVLRLNVALDARYPVS